MADVWPFRPLPDSVEQLSWATDVMRTSASEMRVALRPARQGLIYSYSARDPLMGRMAEMIRAAPLGEWLVPVWWDASAWQPVGAAQTAIPVPPGEWAGQALVWAGCDDWALVDVASQASGQITLAAPVGREFARAVVVPVRRCIAPAGISGARVTDGPFGGRGGAQTAQIEWLSREVVSEPSAPAPTHQGLPVWRACGLPEPASHRFTPPVAAIDTEMGPVVLEQLRETLRGRWTTSAVTTDRQRLRDMRGFLRFVNGRDRPFWLAGWAQDLRAEMPLAAHATVLSVQPVLPLASYAGRVLAIDDGTLTLHAVTGATEAGGLHVITLAAPLGRPVARARLSFARQVRLDTDLIELQHRHGFSARLTLPVAEIPA